MTDDESPQARVSSFDRRMMAAAIRYSYRNLGRTGTNPSVATLIVREAENGPQIVGRGLTAVGGRPHAETEALLEAGPLAEGATAYVTLEPCAHHGSTPPCATALIDAGVKRVVAATTDPDNRVSGRGYRMLCEAGLEVVTDVMKADADRAMAGYMMQRLNNRAHVTLKLAVSADGKIGRRGAGQVAITGPESLSAVHVMRSMVDVILVGIETVLEDDPALTCRLPGLEGRSPVRVVLDRHLRLPLASKLVQTAHEIPVIIATTGDHGSDRYQALLAAGCQIMGCDEGEFGIALPELLEDLALRGHFSVLVEGGASVARSFLDASLVDRIALFTGPGEIGADGVASPLDGRELPVGFARIRDMRYGADRFVELERAV